MFLLQTFFLPISCSFLPPAGHLLFPAVADSAGEETPASAPDSSSAENTERKVDGPPADSVATDSSTPELIAREKEPPTEAVGDIADIADPACKEDPVAAFPTTVEAGSLPADESTVETTAEPTVESTEAEAAPALVTARAETSEAAATGTTESTDVVEPAAPADEPAATEPGVDTLSVATTGPPVEQAVDPPEGNKPVEGMVPVEVVAEQPPLSSVVGAADTVDSEVAETTVESPIETSSAGVEASTSPVDRETPAEEGAGANEALVETPTAPVKESIEAATEATTAPMLESTEEVVVDTNPGASVPAAAEPAVERSLSAATSAAVAASAAVSEAARQLVFEPRIGPMESVAVEPADEAAAKEMPAVTPLETAAETDERAIDPDISETKATVTEPEAEDEPETSLPGEEETAIEPAGAPAVETISTVDVPAVKSSEDEISITFATTSDDSVGPEAESASRSVIAPAAAEPEVETTASIGKSAAEPHPPMVIATSPVTTDATVEETATVRPVEMLEPMISEPVQVDEPAATLADEAIVAKGAPEDQSAVIPTEGGENMQQVTEVAESAAEPVVVCDVKEEAAAGQGDEGYPVAAIATPEDNTVVEVETPPVVDDSVCGKDHVVVKTPLELTVDQTTTVDAAEASPLVEAEPAAVEPPVAETPTKPAATETPSEDAADGRAVENAAKDASDLVEKPEAVSATLVDVVLEPTVDEPACIAETGMESPAGEEPAVAATATTPDTEVVEVTPEPPLMEGATVDTDSAVIEESEVPEIASGSRVEEGAAPASSENVAVEMPASEESSCQDEDVTNKVDEV